MTDRTSLAETFRRFGEIEAAGQLSPLYVALSAIVATDPDLLELASHAPAGQPPPNLLFAAVHYLLEAQREHPLAVYYPSVGGPGAVDDELGAAFRRFCAANRDEIARLMRTRLVQTNEVRRSACLLPAFAAVADDAGGASLALIEIGPSAGLNLLFDLYAYDYGAGLNAGAEHSTVRLDCDARGTLQPRDVVLPKVASRIGIDINPLDVGDERDVRWLRALIWPEHEDRRRLLEAAVKLARRDPPLLISPDLFGALPGLLALVPPGTAPCLFATMVLNQFTPEMRARLRSTLEAAGRAKPVYLSVMGFSEFATGVRVAAEANTHVWLLRFGPAGSHARLVADCSPHGRWLEYQRDSQWRPLA